MKINILILTIFVASSIKSFAQVGGLDRDFGSNGIITTSFGSSDKSYSITVQKDGKILVAGKTTNGAPSQFAIARYNTNGALDATFAGDGKNSIMAGSNESYAQGIVVQSDGKIDIAGYAKINSHMNFSLIRLEADGSLDESFGNKGQVITAINSYDNICSAMAIQGDGKIVLAGYSNDEIGNTPNEDFTVVRYNVNGNLDASFNSGGIKSTDVNGNKEDLCSSVCVQPDGKIIAAGQTDNGSNIDFCMIRYNADGIIDKSFNANSPYGGGIVTTDFNESNDYGITAKLQTDGKILLAGYTDSGSTLHFAMARYESNGLLDSSFGNSGKIIIPLVGGEALYSVDCVIQQDGKILFTGSTWNGTNYDISLARCNSDGTLDKDFGTNGTVITAIGSGDDVSNSMTLQSDGKILVSGWSYNGTDYDFAVARYISGLNVGVIDLNVGNHITLISPDPVSKSASLKYTLVKDDAISIELYDEAGRKVQTFLGNQTRHEGEHSEILNFDNSLSSGNYLLVLSDLKSIVSVKIVKE